jgi:transcription initiation factor TFIID subunit 6
LLRTFLRALIGSGKVGNEGTNGMVGHGGDEGRNGIRNGIGIGNENGNGNGTEPSGSHSNGVGDSTTIQFRERHTSGEMGTRYGAILGLRSLGTVAVRKWLGGNLKVFGEVMDRVSEEEGKEGDDEVELERESVTRLTMKVLIESFGGFGVGTIKTGGIGMKGREELSIRFGDFWAGVLMSFWEEGGKVIVEGYEDFLMSEVHEISGGGGGEGEDAWMRDKELEGLEDEVELSRRVPTGVELGEAEAEGEGEGEGDREVMMADGGERGGGEGEGRMTVEGQEEGEDGEDVFEEVDVIAHGDEGDGMDEDVEGTTGNGRS